MGSEAQGPDSRVVKPKGRLRVQGRQTTNWRDAEFPETPGKILNTTGEWREGKDSESSNYSNFPLPAKITDGATYTQILTAGSVLSGSWRESANYFSTFASLRR